MTHALLALLALVAAILIVSGIVLIARGVRGGSRAAVLDSFTIEGRRLVVGSLGKRSYPLDEIHRVLFYIYLYSGHYTGIYHLVFKKNGRLSRGYAFDDSVYTRRLQWRWEADRLDDLRRSVEQMRAVLSAHGIPSRSRFLFHKGFFSPRFPPKDAR